MSPICTMPGKMGDVLLSLPVVSRIAAEHGPVTFFTSGYCDPVAPLLRTLPYIAEVFVDRTFQLDHTSFGAQPWDWWVDPGTWSNAYHLGFRHFPRLNQSVPELAGEPYGITPEPGAWLPPIRIDPEGPIVVHSPPAGTETVRRMLTHFTGRVRQIGTREEAMTPPRVGAEFVICSNYLELRDAMDGCSRFVGFNSGPAILAQGLGLHVTWPWRGAAIREERWVNAGCSADAIDQGGVVRVLR